MTTLEDSTSDKDLTGDVQVTTLDVGPSDLGPVPATRFNWRKTLKSLGSRQAWFGDYVCTESCQKAKLNSQNYGSLLVPNLPFMAKPRELPFYGVDDDLPYLLMIILGLQQ
jgi:hypothetical protein